MRIVFFGTDNFAAHVLTSLHEHYNVVGVVTVPDAPVGRKQILQETPVAALANELGIKVFKPASLKKDLEIEPALKTLNADIFVVAIYSKIIPQNILDIPPHGNINVHPSLLPHYRGPAPIRTPLLQGDTKTGVSILLMDAEVDHGPLLATEEIDIAPNDTNITLTEKLSHLAAPLLVRALDGYINGSITPVPQEHTKATFTHIVSKEDGCINWNKPANEIYNMWRAYQIWPGIYTTWNGKLLKIIECKVQMDSGQFAVDSMTGTVLLGGVIVCGQNTYLQIIKLQPEGKQPMDTKAFINGNKSFIDSVLK